MANSIMTIKPYRDHGTWVFDDERHGLVREPFVSGVPAMIDALVKHIPQAENGFRLTFSSEEFPGYQKEFELVRGEYSGNWYRETESKMEGWLCPALFCYFADAPRKIYARADPLGN